MPTPVIIDRLPQLPPRPADAHKGTFGSVMILAGSEGMCGAAVLAGLGAIHSGVGKVTIATPQSAAIVVAASNPCWMTLPLPEVKNDLRLLTVSSKSLPRLQHSMKSQTAVGVGPGLGQSPEVKSVVESIYHSCEQACVFDADALNHLAQSTVWQNRHIANRIFTPHPRELARLTGQTVEEVNSNRETIAFEFAREHSVVLLLKGANTIITDGQKIAINQTGNPALATAGTGDVLTGLITGLLGQGLEAFDAAQLGAHLHGLAADCLLSEYPAPFITAEIVAQGLADAWRQLESGECH